MYNKDYNVIEYAIDSVFDRHIFLKPTLKSNPTDCYESVFRHSEDITEYYKTNKDKKTGKNTLAGYTGAVWADKLILDIDKEGDLESAKDTICKVLKHLESEYEVDLNWLRIKFSGHKGFHVFIPSELFGGFEASENLPDQLKSIGEKLTDGFKFDFSFYHRTGLIRLENTINSKSGNYAIPLTADELFSLSIDEMQKLAASPRYVELFDLDQLLPATELVKLKENLDNVKTNDEANAQENKTRAQKYEELWQNESEGKRNKQAGKIIGHLVYNNLPNESIDTIVKYWNEQNSPPKSAAEIEKYIKNYLKRYKNSEGKFWIIKRNVNGVYKSEINFYDLIEFLEKEGYAKKYLDESYLFIKIEKNVVEVIPLEQIKDYLITYTKEFYDKSEFNKRELLNELFSRSGYYFGKKLIECIPSIDLNVLRDKKDESNYYFRNGFARVTKDNGITIHNYPELDGRIWKSQIIERDFTPLNGQQKSVYEKFLFNVAGKSPERIKTIKSSIGYLLHGYKDSSNAKVIVLVDEKITENGEPNGRTGKSVFGKALSKVKKATRIDGKNFKFNDRFTFQQVYLDTKILEFNDVKSDFDFEHLFSVTTDDMTIENKNEKPFTLSFDDSPKIIVSTNYTIKGQGPSYTDRLFEIEFSDYYNEKHKPINDFGKLFFDGWDEDEWNRFDNFMLECVELYLKEGLVEYEQINLPRKKLISKTSQDFIEFAENSISINWEYDKRIIYEDFKLQYSYHSLSQRKFTGWTKTYAEYYEYKYETRESSSRSIFWLEDGSSNPVITLAEQVAKKSEEIKKDLFD